MHHLSCSMQLAVVTVCGCSSGKRNGSGVQRAAGVNGVRTGTIHSGELCAAGSGQHACIQVSPTPPSTHHPPLLTYLTAWWR